MVSRLNSGAPKMGLDVKTAQLGWATTSPTSMANSIHRRADRRALPGGPLAHAEDHHHGRTEVDLRRWGSQAAESAFEARTRSIGLPTRSDPTASKREAEPDVLPLPFCSYAPALPLHGPGGQRCHSHESLWPTDPRSGSGNCLGRLGVLTPRQRRLPEADAVASRRPCHPMACCAKPLGMRGALPALVALRLGVRAKACAPAHSGTAALGGSATPAAGEGTPGHILKIHWKMAARPLEPPRASFDKISNRNLLENGRPAAGAGPGQFW